jgi:hypothetical protein
MVSIALQLVIAYQCAIITCSKVSLTDLGIGTSLILLYMNLFAFYLGGTHPQANIEIHDLQFATGMDFEDCFETLRNLWIGEQKGFHIDGYIKLDFVEGYKIDLHNKSQSIKPKDDHVKLFCVHLGGSLQNHLEEQHHTRFVVAKSESAALKKVRHELHEPDWESTHRDMLFDVDGVINLSDEFSLSLTKASETNQSYNVVNLYKKINP